MKSKEARIMHRSTLIVGAIALVLFAVAAVTILLALGKDPLQLIGLLTAMVAPTVVGLLTLAKVDNVEDRIEHIEEGDTDAHVDGS
jgi:hypothetical protein